MDRLLVLQNTEASIIEETISIDENQFIEFLKRKGLQEVASLKRIDYLDLSTDKKPTLSNRYYYLKSLEKTGGRFNYFFLFQICYCEKIAKRTPNLEFIFSRQETELEFDK